MKKILFTSVYSGLILAMGILGGIVFATEPNILARVIGIFFLVSMPILSIFTLLLYISFEVINKSEDSCISFEIVHKPEDSKEDKKHVY